YENVFLIIQAASEDLLDQELEPQEEEEEQQGAGDVCSAPASAVALQKLNSIEEERSKRREGKPNSLDLTFHLLREFLEMAKAEKMAQKALNNKKLLQSIGKK
uniref:Corticotropin-releasing factor domain-containing protein n=1 Tax=Erpetoichthys calabaricus TaxID=27687 RepID=A0A8C4TQY5_ERPCA